jgi:hypothetical protein
MYTHLAWEFHPMLQCRIRLKRLSLDFIEEVWTTSKEFMVREFPNLSIRGCPLCAWGLTEYEVSDR